MRFLISTKRFFNRARQLHPRNTGAEFIEERFERHSLAVLDFRLAAFE